MRTDWTRRVYHIEKKYGFFGEKIEADTAAKWSIEVRRRVKEAETTIWSKEMESKSTLELYRGNKRGISAECFYDNSIGSSLLFEARAGALRTLVYRSHFQDTETGGARCETAKGVQGHVRETERELWKSAMASKTTLRLYSDNKGTITTEPIYDNHFLPP
ncbi:hypothetical protein HPB49_017729 [Dermacentor silvarum]|uniref:Uncharacterized protein n=1 Tax=Dermacentor silvarum TaxID=543639 RepID=A0ACB8DQA5_DERSI|nr:hypothetical protein HPB49_017729 [Dermacentor silvarum]